MQNLRLDPTGLAKPGETRGSMGTGPGVDHQEAAGQVFGQFWNRTEQFFRSKPGPLAGHLDLLLTLCATSIGSESYLIIEKLLHSLHMWCDTLESRSHFRATAAAAEGALRAHAVTPKGLQSPVIARAAVAVVFFT